MHKALAFVVILALFAAAYWADALWQARPLQNAAQNTATAHQRSASGLREAPPVSFNVINSAHQDTLRTLKEDIIFLNFWATWCIPCVAELPQMLNLIKTLNGKAALVTVSIDDTPADIQAFQQKNLNFSKNPPPHTYWIHDKNKTISNTYSVKKIPETFILNKKRHITEHIIGAKIWHPADWAYLLN